MLVDRVNPGMELGSWSNLEERERKSLVAG
jgi:hypothetical protein